MDIYTSDKHDKLRQKVREFAESEVEPIAAELDNSERFCENITKMMGDIGFFGMLVPTKYNGHQLDTLSLIITIEELSRIDVSQAATIAIHNTVGIEPILKYGSKKMRENYLPKLCSGKNLWAFAMTEPNAGSDPSSLTTTAELINGLWRINGKKIFISNAASSLSQGVTVSAVTGKKTNGEKEISTFLINKVVEGYSQEPILGKMMLRASDTSQLLFDNCLIPKECLLGQQGKGLTIMLSTLDLGKLGVAAMGLGCAEGSFHAALKYSQKRKQFGQRISSFQSVSFKLADMALKIELARNILYKACWLRDSKINFSKHAAMAKLYCSEIAKEVTDEAVQIHGGYGLLKNNKIERSYRDQRFLQIGEGTSEIQKIIISRQILDGC